jgi:hypothetical protein
VSIGLGTGSDDVDAILTALDRLVESGPAWEYVAVDGYLSPVPDPRPSLEDILADLTIQP